MPQGVCGHPGDVGDLAKYRRMRDFRRTPEPAGGRTAEDGREHGDAGGDGVDGRRRFVVQRHRARRLHYDLRFEIDGVLVSWAVPKGPTLDPSVKRMAVHVEDHPIEYIDFEGVIPSGEYGGGDVIVWDTGTWEPAKDGDPAQQLARGELHAEVHGEKLRGPLVLVRRDDGAAKDGDKEQWLLLHKKDEHAVPGWDPEEHPRSVLTGRTNDDVKADPDRMWQSRAPAAEAEVSLLPEPAPDGAIVALEELGKEGVWEVFGRDLKVTNLDKVLFPGDPPVTKREFLAYVARVAPISLPYLEGRALNLHRYPDGADTKGFWHKELPKHAPRWLPRWDNPEADPGETVTYLVVDEPAALLWAANFGALEWHPWTSRTEAMHEPTYALIDLDPGEKTSWDELLQLARLHRTALEHLGVTGRAKVTGKRGIQVWIPIRPGYSFDETRAWTEKLSRTVGKVLPDLVSWKWEKKARGGLARLDYTQNAINKTLVAPFSPRPSAGAPVSVPIGWDELESETLRPDRWTITSVLDRLETVGDPLRPLIGLSQSLPALG